MVVTANKARVKMSRLGQLVSDKVLFVLLAGTITLSFLVFAFVYHSHIQLDTSNTKLFIKNKLLRLNKLFRPIPVMNSFPLPEKEVERLNTAERVSAAFAVSTTSTVDFSSVSISETRRKSVPSESQLKRPPYYQIPSCPNAAKLTFWKPPRRIDLMYQSPFLSENVGPKYVTFEPDVGGWNNIRMQMELVLVFAAATGRTLVLPPDQPMYLLNAGKGHQKAHSFADFFPFEYIGQRLSVISMEDFMAREAVSGRLSRNCKNSFLFTNNTVNIDCREEVLYPPHNKTVHDGTIRDERVEMWEYLRNVSACPPWKGLKQFVSIPPSPGVNVSLLPNSAEYKKRLEIFAAGREVCPYDDYWHSQKVVHFISKPGLGYRLLEHFYTFIHFEDPGMDRYYKRFVRDYVHYIDIIFCKAAIIVDKLLKEGRGNYSSFHIRRGEFQYKEVKIPAAAILKNIGRYIPKDERVVFVATDEHNKTFFDAFRKRFPTVRFLNDYMDIADLKAINPNFLGMIDQVVCTRGRVFVGTWFSTFSGYITRMRGYLGYKDSSNWYGDKNHMSRFQKNELPKFPFYMREWNVSWDGIDA